MKHQQHFEWDVKLIPYCNEEQILKLFSMLSLSGLTQIAERPRLYSKSASHRSNLIIEIIKNDLELLKAKNPDKFVNYFKANPKSFERIYKKQTKALLDIVIRYLNQLSPRELYLPMFVWNQQSYFLKRTPKEITEILSIVAKPEPGFTSNHLVCPQTQALFFHLGTIQLHGYSTKTKHQLKPFRFPSNFSVEHYVELFLCSTRRVFGLRTISAKFSIVCSIGRTEVDLPKH